MCGALSLRPAKSEATMLRRIAAMIQVQGSCVWGSLLSERIPGLVLYPTGPSKVACCHPPAPPLRPSLAHRVLQSFILLRESLATLPPLAEALAGARCEVLRAVRDAAGHAAFAELARELEAVLEDDVASSKNAFLNRCSWQVQDAWQGCGGDQG